MNPGSELSPEWHVDQAVVMLSAARPVRVHRLAVPQAVTPHDHTYHEVGVVLAGTGTHLTAAGRSRLRPGTIFVVPPGEVHAIEEPKDLEVFNVYYLSEWLMLDLGLLWTEPGAVPLFLSTSLMRQQHNATEQIDLGNGVMQDLVRELLHISDERNVARLSSLMMRSCFLKCVAMISQAWVAENPVSAGYPFKPAVWSAMQAIERAVGTGSLYSLQRTAADVGYTGDYLSAMFKASVGFSPTEYFQRRRVHRACQLLLDPSATITDVASELGYSDAPHFCRIFKRYRDMTPRDYRRIYNVHDAAH